ncbi:hypothetical protein C2S51_035430 [Perilla frutescens var. frutescens]|nr:hypothetical protein C2S51_035430 [Perilla frutescens var. frutescens]
MEGAALYWYQWTQARCPQITWGQFKQEMLRRYGEDPLVNPFEALIFTQQLGIVNEYVDLFISRLVHVPGLADTYCLGMFLHRLKEEIRLRIRSRDTKDLFETFHLAREIERELGGVRGYQNVNNFTPPIAGSTVAASRSSWGTSGGRPFHGQKSSPMSGSKFNPGKSSGSSSSVTQVILVSQPDEEEVPEIKSEGPIGPMEGEIEREPQLQTMELSQVTARGIDGPQTMKMRGLINQSDLLIIIDSRASHYFISTTVVERLGLTIDTTSRSAVKLGDGRQVAIVGECRDLSIKIGTTDFEVTCFVFPLGNVDLILGVSWLAALGEIKADWSKMTLRFDHEGREVLLRGDHSSLRCELSMASFCKLRDVELGWLVWVTMRDEDSPELTAMGGQGTIRSQFGRTDQRSLRYLLQQSVSNPAQHFWVAKLLGYDFDIEYKVGLTNKAADALSRSFVDGELSALPMPTWLGWKSIEEELRRDPKFSLIIQELEAGSENHPSYSLINGVLYYRGRIVLAKDSGYIPRLLLEFHAECLVCQKSKYDTRAPAELLQPLHITTRVWEDISMDFIGVAEELAERDLVLGHLREHLERAQQRMVKAAHQHRRELHFEVGQRVFIKLRPYRQNLLLARSSVKLAPKFYGPFEVVEKIGSVAYRLSLPAQSRLHPIFHISQLKLAVGNHVVETELPDALLLVQPEFVPEWILRERMVWRGDDRVHQLLVQWHGKWVDEATWVDELELQGQFPEFHLEDKAVWKEG